MLPEIAIGIITNACVKALESGGGKIIEKIKNYLSSDFNNSLDSDEIDKIYQRIEANNITEDMSRKGIEKILSKDEDLSFIIRNLRVKDSVYKNQNIQQINVSGNNTIGDINL